MRYIELILLGVIAMSALGISGSLHRIQEHNLKFNPSEENDLPEEKVPVLHQGQQIYTCWDEDDEPAVWEVVRVDSIGRVPIYRFEYIRQMEA